METIKRFLTPFFGGSQNSVKIDLTNYTKKKLIGRGSFGFVFLAEDNETHEQYAAKISPINDADTSKAFLRELQILMKIAHPTILQFKGYSLVDFDGEENPTILTAYQPNGSLQNLLDLEIRGCAPHEWDITMKYITLYGIARGMKFLHKKSCIHRDLKPANILLTDRLFPQIADFGLAKYYHANDSSELTLCGTPQYAAPEILDGNTNYNLSIDSYSYGLIMYAVLVGKNPFEKYAKTPQAIPTKVLQGYRPEFPVDFMINEDLKDLIQQCWSADPNERPSFENIVDTLKNESIISDLGVDIDTFENYQDIIDEDEVSTDKLTDDYFSQSLSRIKKIDLKSYQSQESRKDSKNDQPKPFTPKIYPPSQFVILPETCQKQVIQAEIGDSTMMVVVAQSLLKGTNNFQQNIELGVRYLKEAMATNNAEAAELYASMLINGDLILSNIERASEIVDKLLSLKSPQSQILWAQLELKKPVADLKKVAQCLANLASDGNTEALFLYAQLCIMPKEKTKLEPNLNQAKICLNLIKKSGNAEIKKKAAQFESDNEKILYPKPTPTPTPSPKPKDTTSETEKSQRHKSTTTVIDNSISNHQPPPPPTPTPTPTPPPPPPLYPCCSSHFKSIVDALKSIGVDSSFNHRAQIAVANGIGNYRGSYDQNVHMLSLLKNGQLRRE